MSTPSAPEGRYASFEAFYPYYIHEHSNRTCRRIHVVEGELLSWYGPRMPRALRTFSRLFRG